MIPYIVFSLRILAHPPFSYYDPGVRGLNHGTLTSIILFSQLSPRRSSFDFLVVLSPTFFDCFTHRPHEQTFLGESPPTAVLTVALQRTWSLGGDPEVPLSTTGFSFRSRSRCRHPSSVPPVIQTSVPQVRLSKGPPCFFLVRVYVCLSFFSVPCAHYDHLIPSRPILFFICSLRGSLFV